MLEFLCAAYVKLLMHILVWAGTKLFRYVRVFVPSKLTDIVVGITFTNSKTFCDYIDNYKDSP